MSDLNPCPHCGKVDTLEVVAAVDLLYDEDERDAYCHSDSFAVVCSAAKPDGPGGCGAQGGFMPTKPEAIEAWNRRAQPAPITSESGNQAAQGASAITSGSVLTDEEIVYLTDEIPLREGCFIKVARAIEQAVRSKLGAAR